MKPGRHLILALLVLVWAAPLAAAQAADKAQWPSWRGIRRDGKSDDAGLLKAWPAGGPKQLWKATGLGEGFSSVTVAEGTIFTSGKVGPQLAIFAFDLEGKPKWKMELGPEWSQNPAGARSTPVFSEGRVYALSGQGKVACYDAKDGKEVWTRDMKEFGGRPHQWGYAESVLILDKLAIFTPGGAKGMVAVDKKTGKDVWVSEANKAPAHYCSAILVPDSKPSLIVNANQAGLFGVQPKDGRVLWTFDFAKDNVANCPTPAYSDGFLVWAAGYGKGGVCLQLDLGTGKATQVWTSRDLDCHHGGFIIQEGYVYGNNGNGWACLELKTGKTQWQDKGVGKGSLCFADGMLYLFGENGGRCGLAEASPKGFKMAGEFSVQGQGPSWAHPVVTGGRLYLRYGDNLYCFDVKK